MAQNLLRQPHPHSVDLLRNRSLTIPLGPFDGKVAAVAQLGAQHYFITTNTDYVPAVPSLQLPHAVFLRSDMRDGTDDPTLWPQQWTQRYCHMPVIAEKGTRPDLDVMWWDPSQADFEVGSVVMRGLGRLSHRQFSRFLPPINQLVARCRELRKTSPTLAIPLFGDLIQHILMWLEQLQTLPTTYPKMVFAVTSLQRLWGAHVPFWFLRPVEVFDAENILAVVALREPSFGLSDPDAHGDGAPPVLYTGNSTLEKIAAIHSAAIQTPWYHDPFTTTNTRSRSPSAIPVASGSRPVARSNNQQSRYKPYPANAPSKSPAKAPAKTERDKFSVLAVEEMPPSIVSMADALAQVDRSVVPYTSDGVDKQYVLPEPALFVNTTPDRRRKFLHHWNLLADGFIYMLTQHPQLLSAQEWRDVLEGLMTRRGAPGSRTYRRSANLKDRIRPALETSNVSSIEGFPVPTEFLPEFPLEWTREIVWQVAEISFRFELCTLDRRASRKNQLDVVKACFAGHMLVGVLLEMSKCGWASTTLEEHHRYVGRTATLMLDWTTKSPRPNIIRRVAEHLRWSPSEMQALETAVCRYCTQAFWEYFGRAAVVPLRLDHDVEKEDGQL
ncbi:hypothetical protein DFH07DRAFT_780746 [Mycena maculata]|uniref:Uncharacterized protein n=1 Tax=Mycena maculata TaxID=230809 RepID=A0AAD7I1J1_9AGAR|nr:hypothetical protein DFH07DRAFT_780746 [Mycena maculata]